MSDGQNTKNDIFERSVYFLFWFFLFVNIVVFLAYSVLMIKRNIPIIGGGEDIVAAYSWLVSHGRPLYDEKIFSNAPFAYAVYPPVYYYFCGALIKLLGFSNGIGRAVSFFATIISSLMLFSIIRRRGGSASGAAVAGLIFLTLKPVFIWASVNSVNSLAIMLAIMGIWVYTVYEKHRWAFHLCNIFFLLAIYTKQTIIATVAALYLSILLHDWKRGLLLGVIWLALVAGVFLSLNHITHGGYMTHTFAYAKIPLDFRRSYFLLMGKYFSSVSVFLTGMALYLAVVKKKMGFEVIYVAFALILSVLTATFSGSSINYYLELCVALSIVAGMSFSVVGNSRELKLLAYTLMVVALVQSFFFKMPEIRTVFIKGDINKRQVAAIHHSMEYIENNFKDGDKILSEDIEFYLLLDREPLVYDLMSYNMFVRFGVYPRDFVLQDIRERKWKAIVIMGNYPKPTQYQPAYYPMLTSEQLVAIEQNYDPVPEFQKNQTDFTLFIPK